VIEGFATIACGFERDRDVFLDPFLADIFGERFGADTGVEARVFIERSAGDDALGVRAIFARALGHHSSCSSVGHL